MSHTENTMCLEPCSLWDEGYASFHQTAILHFFQTLYLFSFPNILSHYLVINLFEECFEIVKQEKKIVV
jgi:hypothetical protein